MFFVMRKNLIRNNGFLLSFILALHGSAWADVVLVENVACKTFKMGQGLGVPSVFKTTPQVDESMSGRVSYYQSLDLAVLAPTGWRCVGGSSDAGVWLAVAPNLEVGPATAGAGLDGDAVYVEEIYSETRSGEIAIAKIVSRLFPQNKDFVDNVIKENDLNPSDFPHNISVSDIIKNVSSDIVEFETQSNSEGEGTVGLVRKNKNSIRGAYVWENKKSGDLIFIDVRNSDADGVVNIIKEFEGRFFIK